MMFIKDIINMYDIDNLSLKEFNKFRLFNRTTIIFIHYSIDGIYCLFIPL